MSSITLQLELPEKDVEARYQQFLADLRAGDAKEVACDDHMFLRIRLGIAEGDLKPSDINIVRMPRRTEDLRWAWINSDGTVQPTTFDSPDLAIAQMSQRLDLKADLPTSEAYLKIVRVGFTLALASVEITPRWVLRRVSG